LAEANGDNVRILRTWCLVRRARP